ncbi:glycogen synthase GlgA [Pollutimonas nitritireducens]|uniref:Glycogen synthase n=1 Tax=Pollutimonas nitritireducens TaxID=2045209 RepID=A0A2N4UHP2_9BURK|nr:glycogen synthase GlgA [Pollutimonas nitritireducens]PLC54543.1 glycogen synthase GlgA [Pollutimonas nitritireducens]
MVLRILAVTSEAFPLAKTGGLGDAVSGLSMSVQEGGAQVTLLLPAYPSTMSHVSQVSVVSVLDGLPGGDATLLSAYCPELGLPVLLLKNDALYERAGYYVDPDGIEYADNALRFAALSHGAARIAQGLEGIPRPHIVHAHDWHTALTPLLMHQMKVTDIRTVLTLHNVAFQGVFPMANADALGIAPQYRTDEGMEYWGQLNFLKAGIRYADLITVVSHNYAREILTPRFGCGLEGVLATRSSDIISIPNGIDTKLWNPQADPYLRGRPFSADHLSNKALCKSDLQRSFGLVENPRATVMAMGSRLTSQKMADLAANAIPMALDAHTDLQVCIMGMGDHALEARLSQLVGRYPGRCSVSIGFEEARAHLLHAGADMLLHGSRFEPFGLTPLYSMRYGTIPVASRVGGMADTIVDPGAGQAAGAMHAATGVLFDGESTDDMVRAIARAMGLRSYPAIWRAMQMNGMRADFSWAKTAPAYLSAYQSLCPAVGLERIPERISGRLSERMPERRRATTGFVGQANRANPGVLAARSGAAAGTTGKLNRLREGVSLEPMGPHRASAA